MVRSPGPCVSLGSVFGPIGKLSVKRGARALFCGVWTYIENVVDF